MNLCWRNLIISFIGVITFLFLASGNTYSETKAINKSSSDQSKYDSLVYATPSSLYHQNFFSVASTTTCPSGSTPTFKPGQVVSSDVFNDIFSRVENVAEGIKLSSEIVGTWGCTVYATDDMCLKTGFYGAAASGFFATFEDTVTFTNNANGTYSYASANYPLSTCTQNAGTWGPASAVPETGIYMIIRNHILMKPNASINWVDNGHPNLGFLPLHKLSKHSFVLEISSGRLITCDRQDIPPADPTDLSASVFGRNITLTWTNPCNSTATSLKILRKESLRGNYSVVATLQASGTSYSETVRSAGTYWYRVKATNSYGDSDGSNVADVTVQ